ncbi:MAG: FkbM family methyltransferase [Nitrososphaerota archaeon]|nr:FkbM family methyltransferase [Nitrososphaerota archaeon]
MTLLRAVRWKLEQKRELSLSVFDLISERFNSKLREKNRNDYFFNLPMQLLKDKYDLKIPDGITPRSLKEVLIDRVYEQLDDFIPKPGEVVVDIGAQFGDYAFLCAKMFGAEVFSFEPLRKNYELMLKFLRVNGVNNVHTYNVLLGAGDYSTGVLTDDGMTSSPDLTYETGKRYETHEMRTLDSFKLKAPAILKIDVEGFEMDVLKGAAKTLRLGPKVIVEVHSRELRTNVIQHLGSLGYGIRHENAIKRSTRGRKEISELYFSHV